MVGALALFLILLYLTLLAAPMNFPRNSIVNIPAGTSVEKAGALLKEKGVISSPFAFSMLLRMFHPSGIIANYYAFKNRENVIAVAWRLAEGTTDLVRVRVTVPEGSSTFEIAAILKNAFGEFDTTSFIKLATPHEGYLFPDTYFFLPNTRPEDIIAMMQKNFDEKVQPLEKNITAFGKPEKDVIAMASLLEREARQLDTRRTVAGILWKRVRLGMPLQVDAVFGYILGESGYAPTLDDLKIDSPYNTYLHKNLPPGPIGNPGLGAIEAAITPIQTPYLYYLTDKEGNIYYAKTFEEHLVNKKKL